MLVEIDLVLRLAHVIARSAVHAVAVHNTVARPEQVVVVGIAQYGRWVGILLVVLYLVVGQRLPEEDVVIGIDRLVATIRLQTNVGLHGDGSSGIDEVTVLKVRLHIAVFRIAVVFCLSAGSQVEAVQPVGHLAIQELGLGLGNGSVGGSCGRFALVVAVGERARSEQRRISSAPIDFPAIGGHAATGSQQRPTVGSRYTQIVYLATQVAKERSREPLHGIAIAMHIALEALV